MKYQLHTSAEEVLHLPPQRLQKSVNKPDVRDDWQSSTYSAAVHTVYGLVKKVHMPGEHPSWLYFSLFLFSTDSSMKYYCKLFPVTRSICTCWSMPIGCSYHSVAFIRTGLMPGSDFMISAPSCDSGRASGTPHNILT